MLNHSAFDMQYSVHRVEKGQWPANAENGAAPNVYEITVAVPESNNPLGLVAGMLSDFVEGNEPPYNVVRNEKPKYDWHNRNDGIYAYTHEGISPEATSEIEVRVVGNGDYASEVANSIFEELSSHIL